MTNNTLNSLQPSDVWKYFSSICNIPRPSGYPDKISSFIEDFGKQLHLPTIRDNTGNVVIKKPASIDTRQHENPIVLHAHLDMVSQTNIENFDFKTMAITPIIEGDWVTAKDTTLGADNGIGMALIMALLASKNIEHGPLEALFTTETETNKAGAFNLAANVLTGNTLINLDSESDKEICIASAGGIKTHITFNYAFETVAQHDCFKLELSGLTGGHSGCDIVSGRGNAIDILVRILWECQQRFDLHLANMQAGSPVYNAIPRKGFALIAIPKLKTKHFLNALSQIHQNIIAEHQGTEQDIHFEITPLSENLPHVIERKAQKKILAALFGCLNGIIRIMPEEHDKIIPETSSSLSYLTTQKDHITIFSMQRSLVESAKLITANKIQAIFELAGGQVKQIHSFPSWTKNANSPILHTTVEAYRRLFHHPPKMTSSHLGLECGIFKEKYPNLDIISIGPTILDPHSPGEKLNISSVDKIWKLLIEVLKKPKA